MTYDPCANREEELKKRFSDKSVEYLLLYSESHPDCEDFHEYIVAYMGSDLKSKLLKEAEKRRPISTYSMIDPDNGNGLK